MTRRWLVPILIIALLAGGLLYRQNAGAPVTEERQFLAFGTLISITLRHPDPQLRARGFKQTIAAFERWHEAWHAWEPSELTELNAALAGDRSAEVAPELAELLKQAKILSLCSGGQFDPAIGGLLKLWGFQSSAPTAQPPDPAALKAYLAQRPSMADLQINGTTVSSRNPHLQLDLGAIAKGYAIDVVARKLQALGLQAFIINTGGDLRARAGNGTPWRIGVRDPEHPGEALAVIRVSGDESIFTSGNYERFFESGGRRYHHILDPRSGYPALSVASATVIHPNATLADAAATALLVAGLSEWSSVAFGLGLDSVLLIDSDGSAYVTPAMADRLEWQQAPKQHLTLALPATGSLTPPCPPLSTEQPIYSGTTDVIAQ